MTETPDWKPGDTVRSAIDVLKLVAGAARMMVGAVAERIDTHFADKINGGED